MLSVSHPEATEQSLSSDLYLNLMFNQRSISEPHKVTHLHPSGIVSYSILRPPSANAVQSSSSSDLPVLLQLHGAGNEASSKMVSGALNSLPDLRAWVLFPTGVTPWSADDWHAWGSADVQAAVDNIPHWIERHGFNSIGVNTETWVVSGHSNGGQGTWYTLTHHPDRVLGAAPVSGYLSIQQYVPYTNWHPMDPKKRAIVEAASNSYRLELLASNAKGIDIEQQHGAGDDNVPPYQSRLMAQLLAEANGTSNLVELSQPGDHSGHWYDGVMTTDHLRQFYERMCEKYQKVRPSAVKRELNWTEDISFSLVVGNPADQGSKGGIRVAQLRDPGQLGKLHVFINSKTRSWEIRSANILSFEILPITELPYRSNEGTIDGQQFIFPQYQQRNITLRRYSKEWKVMVMPSHSTYMLHLVANLLLGSASTYFLPQRKTTRRNRCHPAFEGSIPDQAPWR
jgi:predicted esterase